MPEQLTHDQLYELIMRLSLADQLRLIEKVTAHALGQLAPQTSDDDNIDQPLTWPTTRTYLHDTDTPGNGSSPKQGTST